MGPAQMERVLEDLRKAGLPEGQWLPIKSDKKGERLLFCLKKLNGTAREEF
jgi:hypothetical protein